MTIKYEAIVCDFDGTLVGADLKISENVKNAIRSLKEKSVKFVIASGRAFNGPVEDACHEMNLVSPQIVRGGAEIIDSVTGEIIIKENIPDTDLLRLINFVNENNLDYWVEKELDVYTLEGKPRRAFGDVPFRDLKTLQPHDVPKIGIFVTDENKFENIYQKLLIEFPSLHAIKAFSPAGRAFDITAAMANKQQAVLHVLKLLNLSRDEVIGIGDGYNDFPLLEACGYKVATEDANESLKAIADKIIPSYKADGVAKFIEELIENEMI